MKVNVLGTEWTINTLSQKEEPRLVGRDGFTDNSVKEIFIEEIESYKDDPSCPKRLDIYQKKVIRHEIIHAFLLESGLSVCSDWAENEEMVDYFAAQMPKMVKAFEEAGCM